MEYTKHAIDILRNVYRKMDSLPLSFGGLPLYNDNISDDDVIKSFGIDLIDTLRELGLKSVDSIDEMSTAELNIENRVVYYALRRFRNSSSAFFKFSTAIDGKTVDKSMIPKMLNSIINEYDNNFKKWRSTSHGTSGSKWDINNTVLTNGNYSSS